MVMTVSPRKLEKTLPDERGRFGSFGGRYVPETVIPALEELDRAFSHYRNDEEFVAELDDLLKFYVGRPTPIYRAVGLERLLEGSGAQRKLEIYLKREDLNHTGAHKINNALGQVLLTRRMGKTRVIAETGAGQHGVATATACALLGCECKVFMGEVDMKRQALNVFRMRLLGSEVVPVTSGTKTLKDACNEAIRYWVTNVEDTHYVIGSVVGPHPYPLIVRHFQSVIGREARQQFLEQTGALPDAVVACVGGGSNAMGIFSGFLADESVRLIGVEAAGRGINTGEHAATITAGQPGVLHGSHSYVLQDEEGQIQEAYSISAGLDYPGVGPEHSYLHEIGRAEYVHVTDAEAVAALKHLTRSDGILPALESAHALAYVEKMAQMADGAKERERVLVCLSGRGDKDVGTIASEMGVDL